MINVTSKDCYIQLCVVGIIHCWYGLIEYAKNSMVSLYLHAQTKVIIMISSAQLHACLISYIEVMVSYNTFTG